MPINFYLSLDQDVGWQQARPFPPFSRRKSASDEERSSSSSALTRELDVEGSSNRMADRVLVVNMVLAVDYWRNGVKELSKEREKEIKLGISAK